jgi:hypothetical protein
MCSKSLVCRGSDKSSSSGMLQRTSRWGPSHITTGSGPSSSSFTLQHHVSFAAGVAGAASDDQQGTVSLGGQHGLSMHIVQPSSLPLKQEQRYAAGPVAAAADGAPPADPMSASLQGDSILQPWCSWDGPYIKVSST